MNPVWLPKMKFLLFLNMAFGVVLASPALAQNKPSIEIDGSSTVYPITKALAEEFGQANPGVEISVAFSGTGGGFKKFCTGITDITNASRPITHKEQAFCKENGVEYIELPVAFDGIAIVANPQNDWLENITVSELKKIWQPEAQGLVTHWNHVREQWPAEVLNLYGPGIDSGTYDYFTKVIVGVEDNSRADYTSSEDDLFLVECIAKDKFALGFFGLAYYTEHKDQLKLIAVDRENGRGPILPTAATIHSGGYTPLSRPIFIYVKKESIQRPEVDLFVQFYLTHAATFVKTVGYIPLSDEAYRLIQQRYTQRKQGSMFTGEEVGASLEDILETP